MSIAHSFHIVVLNVTAKKALEYVAKNMLTTLVTFLIAASFV